MGVCNLRYCRITVLDPVGQAYVADVNEGELWIFPNSTTYRAVIGLAVTPDDMTHPINKPPE